jgi:hypothetical protein
MLIYLIKDIDLRIDESGEHIGNIFMDLTGFYEKEEIWEILTN